MALAKMTWDELNQLVGYKVSESFKEYYAPMKISAAQKRKRTKLAEQINGLFIGLLSEYFYAEQLKIIVMSDIYERTRREYLEIIENYVQPDEYIIAHVLSTITNTIEVLLRHKEDPYFYSKDRARAIAENEANSIFNHTEYEDAIKNKHFKTWNTIMDGRERDSHAEVNGITIPIDEPFQLRGGYLQYPRDDSLDVSDDEIVGCRCSLTFS